MKLVAYRKHRDPEDLMPAGFRFYAKMGMKESFLRDVKYSGPHELIWAVIARHRVGRRFSRKVRDALASQGIEAEIEERPKRLRRMLNKLTSRSNRDSGLEASRIFRFLASLNLPVPAYPFGSIRDFYGVRVIIPTDESSRSTCYHVLEKVLEAGEINHSSQLLSLVDYLSYPKHRYGPEGNYLGRYESVHASFLYMGVPIEVQVRDTEMDWNAKNLVKRNGLD